MGNQIAIRSQTRPGDEILRARAGPRRSSTRPAAIAALSGAQTRMHRRRARACSARSSWRARLRDPADDHHARPHLVCVENTIGEQGGLIFPHDRIDAHRTLRARARPAPAPGRRAALERRRRQRSDSARERGRDVDSVSRLLLEGPGRPGRLGRRRRRRADRAGAPQPQAVRAAACARPASSRPAPCTPLRHHASAWPTTTRNARAWPRGWPAAAPARWTRAASRPTSCSAPSRPARTPAAQVVAEMAAAGVLCADLSPRTVRFVTHLDADEDAVSAGSGALAAAATVNVL